MSTILKVILDSPNIVTISQLEKILVKYYKYSAVEQKY